VGAGWVTLHDVKGRRTVSAVDWGGEIGNVCRCLYRTSLVPLPGPHDAQPPQARPGGEPALRYWTPPVDPYMSLFGSSCGSWIIPDLVYANA
jgi:hypothetical protein